MHANSVHDLHASSVHTYHTSIVYSYLYFFFSTYVPRTLTLQLSQDGRKRMSGPSGKNLRTRSTGDLMLSA